MNASPSQISHGGSMVFRAFAIKIADNGEDGDKGCTLYVAPRSFASKGQAQFCVFFTTNGDPVEVATYYADFSLAWDMFEGGEYTGENFADEFGIELDDLGDAASAAIEANQG